MVTLVVAVTISMLIHIKNAKLFSFNLANNIDDQ